MKDIFKGVKDFELEDHFIRIPWNECMKRFGSDKPDLRFGNEIQDITDLFSHTEFQVFRNVIESNGMIGAVKFEMHRINTAARDWMLCRNLSSMVSRQRPCLSEDGWEN
jgi:aspartyl-tRNA synthetase